MNAVKRLQEKLLAEKNKKAGSGAFQQDNAVYPFRDIPDGGTVVFRFLPDADPDNCYFWVTRQVINLPFAGIIGGDKKPTTVTVPCMTMYNQQCPITEAIKPLWSNEDTKPIARTYWRMETKILQGFVTSSSFTENNPPENPIRRFVLRPAIWNKIYSDLDPELNPDLEYLPTDYVNGMDFKVKKTKRGDFPNYDSSNWGRPRALTESEHEAIEKYGLFNLKEFLPKQPNDEELKVIMEMFEASMDGEMYDPERWGNYYKPWGLNVQSSPNTSTTSDDAVNLKKAETEVPPFATVEPAVTNGQVDKKPSPEEIMSRLRARTGAKA